MKTLRERVEQLEQLVADLMRSNSVMTKEIAELKARLVKESKAPVQQP